MQNYSGTAYVFLNLHGGCMYMTHNPHSRSRTSKEGTVAGVRFLLLEP